MAESVDKKGFSGFQVFVIIMLVMLVTVAGTIFAARFWFFPTPFAPVVLNQQEEVQLKTKLRQFEMLTDSAVEIGAGKHVEKNSDGTLKPETYSEVGASRSIALTQREVNALLATNTDLADKLAIDFADNLISAKMLIPVDPDFPILGGKILRVKAGVELSYHQNRPVVIIKGVSVMGVPIPTAWMGGLKNIDLVQKFGSDEGFWQTFSAGVDSINVVDGRLLIQFKE